jgi:hypothetical protein
MDSEKSQWVGYNFAGDVTIEGRTPPTESTLVEIIASRPGDEMELTWGLSPRCPQRTLTNIRHEKC